MNKYSTLLFTALLILLTTNTLFASGSKLLTPDLQAQMQKADSDEFIRINITMAKQFDSQNLIKHAKSLRGEARRQYVISVLKDFSAFSQKGVVAELNRSVRAGNVEKVTTYWIANVINCYATPEAIRQLEGRNDISSIDYDEKRVLLDPNERKNAIPNDGVSGSREITWNVLKINADDVWALGFNGEGVIVAVIDTGVNYDHLDLEDHVWESDEYPNHGYDFANLDNDPKDDNGHGTFCAGTVAGNGTAGSQTGVAPEATIMCLKALDLNGSASESGVWSAVEFAVEHGANVMSLSVGWKHAYNPNRTAWRQAFDNSLAAGVVASVAAGNDGNLQSIYPVPDNAHTPGDCPPPWLNPDQSLQGGVSGVICVGSVTSNDEVSYFSSRGPVDWSGVADYNDYPYDPEMGLIRPDIAAPGSNIKSLAHYSNTGYEDGWDGTSMATPAAAGMMALMLQKNMTLSPAKISQIVEETTVVLQQGKNSNSGSGRIDCLAAVEATPIPGPVYYSHSFNDESGNNNGKPDMGETVLLTLNMANLNNIEINNITVEISTDNEFVTVIDGSEYYGDFGFQSMIEKEDAFAFEVADNIPDSTIINFNISAHNDESTWLSSFADTAIGVNIVPGNHWFDDASGNNNGFLDPGENVDFYIEVRNIGQINAENTTAQLISNDPFVTVNTGTLDLETFESGETAETMFNISIDDDTPPGKYVELVLKVETGGYVFENEYTFRVGKLIEDFETGNFSKFEWSFDGDADWVIDDTAVYEGQYAARSGEISHQEISELKLPYDVDVNDSIAFRVKVSSESGADFLQFFIDEVKQDQWSGEVDWKRVVFPVSSGEHTFRWVYDKDWGESFGEDCGWIDFVELPAIANNTMTISAGDDAEICEGLNFQTQASGANYESLQWTSSGSGTFDDATVINAIYTPSEQDWVTGSVTLTLTATGNGNSITDDMELAFDPLPEDAGTISGAGEVCNGTTEDYAISALANSDSYNWVITPGSAGTIDGTTNQVYITWDEDYTGDAVIKVQGVNSCGEGAFSENFMVTVEECLPMTVSAGDDAEICEGLTFQTQASGANYESLQWASSGTGTFNDASVLETIYTPGEQDWVTGTVTLSLTATGNGNSITDDMVLTFDPLPDDAGAVSGADSVCRGWSTSYSTSVIPNCDSYTWVISPSTAGTIQGTGNQINIDWDNNFLGEAIVKVQGVNNCGEGAFSTDHSVIADACTGVDEPEADNIMIMPNPNNGCFSIGTALTNGIAEIVNLSGKVVYTQNVTTGNIVIDASMLNNGIYFIRIRNNEHLTVKKLIIQK